MNHQEIFLKFTVGNPDDQEIFLNVTGVLLQPFQTLFKYTNLKGVLIECRWLTTPKRVTKVMPVFIRAHLETQPDSASLENLGNLANRALASENDAKDISAGVAEIQVSESVKLIRLLEDLF